MNDLSQELFRRAQVVMPGGVSSPVRAFTAVGGDPYFVSRGEGPYVWDVDGRRLIDLVQGYGPIIAGHAHPSILNAIKQAAADGTTFGAPTERELLLAEAICERVPSCEKVRLVSSGTEATMSAIRVARAFTERSKIVKFAGNYHGHSDQLLVASGSGVATLGLPGSAGVTPDAIRHTLVLPYNKVPILDRETACVIVEPIAGNMGLVVPDLQFLHGLREECDRVGALLIFDEVITGFRVARGGAQELFGIRPDLSTFGKVIGGGLSMGAYGGRSEAMDLVAPLGPVYQAGTLSGNPLAAAAGLAALSLLNDDAYQLLYSRAMTLAKELRAALDRWGSRAKVTLAHSMVGVSFGEANSVDEKMYSRFFHHMLTNGIALPPGPLEVLFPGLMHDDEILAEVGRVAARFTG